MRLDDTVKPGSVVVYDDGREGHRSVSATVLNVSKTAMTVQFEDRADTTRIAFNQKAWTDHLGMK